MKVTPIAFGSKLIQTDIYPDERGHFVPLWTDDMCEIVPEPCILDNYSFSKKGVIRGLHSQEPPQAKLVRCARGKIVDIIVDAESGAHAAIYLDRPYEWIFIPRNLFHGFVALEDSEVHYKVDVPFHPDAQMTIRYNDHRLNIPWEKYSGMTEFILSQKDLNGAVWVE